MNKHDWWLVIGIMMVNYALVGPDWRFIVLVIGEGLILLNWEHLV